MTFKINENQRADYYRALVEPPAQEQNSNQSVPMAVNSKLGENNLYALLQKNSILSNSSIVSLQSNSPVFENITHSVFTKTDNKSVPISSVQNSDNSIFDKIAETFATVIDAVFPFAGNESDTVVNQNLVMGNPSDAVTNADSPNNYLLVKDQYTSSYDRDRGIPNWTSWHLDSDSLGSTSRQNDFRPDETLPDDWYQVTPEDYRGSGYDRGHMTPSGDRTASREDNSATFLMTNMIPQASKNNQQTWANLENYCRELVGQGNELYIVAGGQGTKEYIADGKVAVPENTWKVILVQPEGTDDLSRVTAETRVISVYIPNDNNVVSDWKNYTVSTDFVEQQTGFDFFSEVPDEIENQIEARVD
jgi:DNA/RNA endonuclease G (NUC1)